MSVFTDSFGGIAFIVINEARRSDRGRVGVHEIPGGGDVYIDLGGKSAPTFSLDLLFDSQTVYNSMLPLVGTRDTLIFSEGTFTATLVSLTRNRSFGDLRQEASAEFIIA